MESPTHAVVSTQDETGYQPLTNRPLPMIIKLEMDRFRRESLAVGKILSEDLQEKLAFECIVAVYQEEKRFRPFVIMLKRQAVTKVAQEVSNIPTNSEHLQSFALNVVTLEVLNALKQKFIIDPDSVMVFPRLGMLLLEADDLSYDGLEDLVETVTQLDNPEPQGSR